MLSFEEVNSIWGCDGLIKYPPQLLEGISMSEDAKKLLGDIGVPKAASLGITFLPRICRVRDLPSPYPEGERSPETNALFALARFSYDLICFEPNSELIMTAPDDILLPQTHTTIINSSISQFIESLFIYDSTIKPLPDGVDDEDLAKATASLESRLVSVDPYCLSQNSFFWSVKLDDLKMLFLENYEPHFGIDHT